MTPADRPPSGSRGVAVVTGAASGLGEATAVRLHSMGWSVIGWDVSPSIRRSGPHLLAAEQVDVTDADQVGAAAARVIDTHQGVDLLVNAAGVLLVAQLPEVTGDQIRRLFDVNVLGTTLVTQALLPALEIGPGAVVNVASNTALRAVARNAHYAASKAAVLQLTRSWALELAGSGIRVNAVCPGAVRTRLFASAGLDQDAVDALFAGRAQRRGTAEDVAYWIVHLGTEDRWATGTHVVVDGGSSLG